MNSKQKMAGRMRMQSEDLILSTSTFPPSGSRDLGIIYGVSCISTNFIRDTLASVRNITIGGELKSYADMLKTGIANAEKRLREEAARLNADGVYAVKIATPQITTGAAEIIMYGTAFNYV